MFVSRRNLRIMSRKLVAAAIVSVLGVLPSAHALATDQCTTTRTDAPRIDDVRRSVSLVCEISLPQGKHSLSAVWADPLLSAGYNAVGRVQIVISTPDLSIVGYAECDIQPDLGASCSAYARGFDEWSTRQTSPGGWLHLGFVAARPVKVYFSVGETTLFPQVAGTIQAGYGSFSLFV